MQKNCAICGKPFEAKQEKQLYCSQQCKDSANAARAARYRAKIIYKYCERCGKRFYSGNAKRVLCTACLKPHKHRQIRYIDIVEKNRANPIETGWRGQPRIAARPALHKF